jgi:hydroxymethylpyrimidine pyrophosphatase-like HAD family hydrolase
MPKFFRAVAIDYDGTLTSGGAPAADVIAALEGARQEGYRLVLATGRTIAHLMADFAGAKSLFDAIVAENGAVVWTHWGGTRLLAEPPDRQLEEALWRRGIPVRRGQVLVDTFIEHDRAALEEIGRLGLECHLVRNRNALMIVPPGISKGFGLFEVLGDLGISHHSTIGIGDAENDHSLLTCCEVGVAVGNAIESLKAHADIALTQTAGEGVASFLRGPVLRGDIRVHPRRWQVELGTFGQEGTTSLPASQINLLITGGSRSGKSYLAGLVAERLIQMGYSVCVLDAEGDHTDLGILRGVVTAGGVEPPPAPEQLNRLLRHRFGSVVIDLSLMPGSEKTGYMQAALEGLHQLRADTGLPHWILLDEAHLPIGSARTLTAPFDLSDKGYCLVTYRPQELHERALQEIDAVVISSGMDSKALTRTLGSANIDPSVLREVARLFDRTSLGQAVLVRPSPPGTAQAFTFHRRLTPHVRHLHKYIAAQLPFERRFFFRRGAQDTGQSAGNLGELDRMLGYQHEEVVKHHAMHGDFSRWIRDVLQDGALAETVSVIERDLANLAQNVSPPAVETARVRILRAIEDRYLDRPRVAQAVPAGVQSPPRSATSARI